MSAAVWSEPQRGQHAAHRRVRAPVGEAVAGLVLVVADALGLGLVGTVAYTATTGSAAATPDLPVQGC